MPFDYRLHVMAVPLTQYQYEVQHEESKATYHHHISQHTALSAFPNSRMATTKREGSTYLSPGALPQGSCMQWNCQLQNSAAHTTSQAASDPDSLEQVVLLHLSACHAALARTSPSWSCRSSCPRSCHASSSALDKSWRRSCRWQQQQGSQPPRQCRLWLELSSHCSPCQDTCTSGLYQGQSQSQKRAVQALRDCS